MNRNYTRWQDIYTHKTPPRILGNRILFVSHRGGDFVDCGSEGTQPNLFWIGYELWSWLFPLLWHCQIFIRVYQQVKGTWVQGEQIHQKEMEGLECIF